MLMQWLSAGCQVADVSVRSWDPTKRLKPEEALQHDWLKENSHRNRPSRNHMKRPTHGRHIGDTIEKIIDTYKSTANVSSVLNKGGRRNALIVVGPFLAHQYLLY